MAKMADSEATIWALRSQVSRLRTENDQLRERLDRLVALDDLFLHMRNRVAGYVSAPPVASHFANGATAFEWAATSVRRAAAGEMALDPPVPIRELRDDDPTEDGYRHHILTCPVCAARFVCTVANVQIGHQVWVDEPSRFYHNGRPISEGGE
jgi:hypothetical protein